MIGISASLAFTVPQASYTVVADLVPVSGTASNPTVYSYKRFVRSSSTRAVVYIDSSSKSYIEFRNCIFDCDYGAYQNTKAALTFNDRNGGIHHIKFYDCLFKGYYDSSTGKAKHYMTFEFTGRPAYSTGSYSNGTYHDIEMYRCTLQPGGYETLSFDDAYNGSGYGIQNQNIVLEDCVIEGGGDRTDTTAYGHGFELNGNYGATIRGMRVQSCRNSMLNLNGPSSGNCGWSFSNCSFSFDDISPRQVVAPGYSGTPQTIHANRMSGATFTACTFNSGTGATHAIDNGDLGYTTACNNNTFSGCSFLGINRGVRVYNGTGNVGLP